MCLLAHPLAGFIQCANCQSAFFACVADWSKRDMAFSHHSPRIRRVSDAKAMPRWRMRATLQYLAFLELI